MIRLGMWLLVAALIGLALVFVPAWLGGAGDMQFLADFVFCDDAGQAIIAVNLSEAALTKGSLGAVIAGTCIANGQRTTIPTQRFSTVLSIGVAVAIGSLLLIFLGFLRRSSRQRPASGLAQVAASSLNVLGLSAPTAAQAERTRQRDFDDAAAHRSANTARAAAAAAAPVRAAAAAAPVADWQIGMPSSRPEVRSAERFSFEENAPAILDSDKAIQLNQLHLAYESSLITRSEYDARRDALLRTASADRPKAP